MISLATALPIGAGALHFAPLLFAKGGKQNDSHW